MGEESFTDANGNHVYDAGEGYADLGEPFRNDRAITGVNAEFGDDAYSSGNATRANGEPYIDSNGSGTWNATGDGQYNGVLRAASSVNSRHAWISAALSKTCFCINCLSASFSPNAVRS